jgi:hypothetical protein
MYRKVLPLNALVFAGVVLANAGVVRLWCLAILLIHTIAAAKCFGVYLPPMCGDAYLDCHAQVDVHLCLVCLCWCLRLWLSSGTSLSGLSIAWLTACIHTSPRWI